MSSEMPRSLATYSWYQPWSGAMRPEVLDQAGARAGHDEGHVGGLGGLGQHHVAAAPEQPDEAGGRDADGARIGLAEDGGALVACGHVDAIARHQPVFVEDVVVAGDSGLALQAALDEIVGDLRQAALGHPAQVVVVDGGINAGGQGALLPIELSLGNFEADPAG